MASHAILALIQGSIGGEPIKLGTKGLCRFCGTTDAKLFRKKSHTIPEALGNKWVVSLDECDACNKLFARYDDALAKSVGSVLTVGGTVGKGNTVRQTGRTGSPAVIKHERSEAGRRISMQVTAELIGDHIKFGSTSNELQLLAPTGTERFVPRYAYKALAKMGVALLPESELPHFSRLRAWLQDPEDNDNIPHLNVGLSFGSVGNAPPLAAAALFKREPSNPNPPYVIFVLSIGSVCFQIELKPDDLDGAWPPTADVRLGLRWNNVIGAPGDSDQIQIPYGEPRQLDWSSSALALSPIESILTVINPKAGAVTMTPVFRSQSDLKEP